MSATVSTTVGSAEEKDLDMTTTTPIQNKYTFWYHRRGGKQSANYEDNIKSIGSFQTVEDFWRIYNHLVRPAEFKTTIDYHLFKYGVKPTWEDDINKQGGKWMVRLKKGLVSHYWEEIVLAVIGEQFDVGHEICGAVCSVRNNEDIISVWNKTADNNEATSKIRDQIRRILNLPTYIQIEYKKHQDSLVDKSSFRNPSIVWRAPAGGGGRGRDGERTGYRQDFNKDREGGHENRPYNRDNQGQKPGWKPRENTSTGDPVKDRENQLREQEEYNNRNRNRDREGGASGGTGGGGAWGAPRRSEEGGNAWGKGGQRDGAAAPPNAWGKGRSDKERTSSEDNTIKKKPVAAAAAGEERGNVWTRGRSLVVEGASQPKDA